MENSIYWALNFEGEKSIFGFPNWSFKISPPQEKYLDLFTSIRQYIYSARQTDKDERTMLYNIATTHSSQIPWRNSEARLTCCSFLFLFSNIFSFSLYCVEVFSFLRSIQHQIERNETLHVYRLFYLLPHSDSLISSKVFRSRKPKAINHCVIFIIVLNKNNHRFNRRVRLFFSSCLLYHEFQKWTNLNILKLTIILVVKSMKFMNLKTFCMRACALKKIRLRNHLTSHKYVHKYIKITSRHQPNQPRRWRQQRKQQRRRLQSSSTFTVPTETIKMSQIKDKLAYK